MCASGRSTLPSLTSAAKAFALMTSLNLILGTGCADARSDRAEMLQMKVDQLTQLTSALQQKVQVLERQQQGSLESPDSVGAVADSHQSTANKFADISPKLGFLGSSQDNQGTLKRSKDKWITRIPTHANDGSPIPQDKLTKIVRRVADEFGGASLDGPGRGIWIGSDGKVFDETSYTLSVACEASEIARAREMVNWIGCELDQQSMYFEIQNCPVEVIPVKQ